MDEDYTQGRVRLIGRKFDQSLLILKWKRTSQGNQQVCGIYKREGNKALSLQGL